jgi:ribose transport system substrate-binding protein/inositol transport system substrate-binding protein
MTLIMATSVLLTQGSCATQSPIRFALLMSHLTNDYTTSLAKAAQEQAMSRGIELVVLDAQHSVRRQAGLIETLVQEGIDGIIVEPAGTTGLEAAMALCKAENIPLVTVAQRVAQSDLADCHVGTDSVEAGRLQMMACLDRLSYSGRIVILHGPFGADAQAARYEGYRSVLSVWPSLQVVAEQEAGWDDRIARTIVHHWLDTGKQFDAIVAQNDDMAIGAIQALKDHGMLGQVQVFGIDASPMALDAIASGEMAATLSQRPALIGREAVLACLNIQKGLPQDPLIAINQQIITDVGNDLAAQRISGFAD